MRYICYLQFSFIPIFKIESVKQSKLWETFPIHHPFSLTGWQKLFKKWYFFPCLSAHSHISVRRGRVSLWAIVFSDQQRKRAEYGFVFGERHWLLQAAFLLGSGFNVVNSSPQNVQELTYYSNFTDEETAHKTSWMAKACRRLSAVLEFEIWTLFIWLKITALHHFSSQYTISYSFLQVKNWSKKSNKTS